MMDDSFLDVLLGSYQCAFADSGHVCDLSVGLPLIQKRQRQGNLFRRELLRSAILEIGILSGNGFSCLGSLHNGASLILSKGKHDSQNQITCQCVFNKSHVQNMNSDTSYSFPLDRFYYYNTEFDTWLNSGKIEPLCPEFSCKACFRVPLEVKENEEAPLFIQFMIDNKDVIYKVR